MPPWVSDTENARDQLDEWLKKHVVLTDEEWAELDGLIDAYGSATNEAGAESARPI